MDRKVSNTPLWSVSWVQSRECDALSGLGVPCPFVGSTAGFSRITWYDRDVLFLDGVAKHGHVSQLYATKPGKTIKVISSKLLDSWNKFYMVRLLTVIIFRVLKVFEALVCISSEQFPFGTFNIIILFHPYLLSWTQKCYFHLLKRFLTFYKAAGWCF